LGDKYSSFTDWLILNPILREFDFDSTDLESPKNKKHGLAGITKAFENLTKPNFK